MTTQYTIRSNKTGKYITSLFSDKQSKTFTANEFNKNTCYFWNVKDIALVIAVQLDGYLEEVTI